MRILVVASCRWVSEIVPCAPYRTQISWLDHFGAHLAVHGDDIANDDTGQDSLAEMKAAGRFCLIKRFSGPGTISTTDLIDRMLDARADHHLPRYMLTKANCKLHTGEAMDLELSFTSRMLEKINLFSCGSGGSNNSIAVFELTEEETSHVINEIVKGCPPSKGQRLVYVDGAFDFFTAGHIAFLEAVTSIERTQHEGLEPYLIVGIYDDTTVSTCKGITFPVMNMVERALLLLQSRVSWIHPFICDPVLTFFLTSLQYVSAVVLSAPFRPTWKFFSLLHPSGISSMYFGAVTFGGSPHKDERYAELKEMGLLSEVKNHSYQDITTEVIRERLLENREAFQLRQRAKRRNTTPNT